MKTRGAMATEKTVDEGVASMYTIPKMSDRLTILSLSIKAPSFELFVPFLKVTQ